MSPSRASKESKRHRFLNRIQGKIQGVFQSESRPPTPTSQSTPDLTDGNNPPSPRPLFSSNLSAPVGESKAPSTSNVGLVPSTATTASLATLAAPDAASELSEVWNVARSGLEVALRALEKSADAFPPLKFAVSGLVACLDVIQASYDSQQRTMSDTVTRLPGSLGESRRLRGNHVRAHQIGGNIVPIRSRPLLGRL
jgi:hypothetical protein